jgi:hypothetical protein
MTSTYSDSYFDVIINLRWSKKQLSMAARAADKRKVRYKKRMAVALAKEEKEKVQIHAQDAIRERDLAIRYRKHAVIFEELEQRFVRAQCTRDLAHTLAGVGRSIERAIHAQDLESLEREMTRFNGLMEDLDVQEAVVQQTVKKVAPDDLNLEREADALIESITKEIAEEAAAKELRKITTPSSVPRTASASPSPSITTALSKDNEPALRTRLERLKSPAQ